MARHLTPRGLVAEARRLGQCGIDRPVLHAPGHVQPADRPTDEWVRSAEHELAVAEVGRELEQAGVRGVHFRAPTVDGRLIGKFVHLRELGHAARHGIRLHPSALTDARADRHGALLAFEERAPELVALPDLSTLRRLPWEPRVAQVLCGVYDPTTGAPAGHCARATLARMNDAFMAETGLAMRVGVEPEVIWVRRRPDGTLEPVAHTISFYDASAMLDFEPVLLDLVDVCDGLGIEVTEASSEGATQLEVNHRPSDPLAAADAVTLFRLACGAVARRRGLIATFMPKPWAGESGSGHHHNLSLHDAEGRTRSAGDLKGRCRLSAEGTHLVAGLLEHIDALTVLGAPSVNSYKRFADAGQWAPTVKRFGFDDRTCVLRVPHPGRVEARHVDASANPYLTITGFLAAALDGLRRGLDPGPPAEELCDETPARIPATLESALAAFDADAVIQAAFPESMRRAFVALRRDELDRYTAQVSAWELDFYLERWP